MESPKVWLITGAAAGFGRSVVQEVLENGDIAVATDLDVESLKGLSSIYPPSRLLVRKLDVSDPDDIRAGFDAAKATFRRVDVVFSNAGYTVQGELEGTPLDVARQLFEVNLWGSVQVSLEAVRFFREVNGPAIGGRLLITTSIAGLVAQPGFGFYSASKHALEGFGESLAAELDPSWHVKVTMIEPGGFRTSLPDSMIRLAAHPAYTNPSLAVSRTREPGHISQVTLGHPVKAARCIFRLGNTPEPPLRLLLGKDAITGVKEKLVDLSSNVDQFESWSEDLVGDPHL